MLRVRVSRLNYSSNVSSKAPVPRHLRPMSSWQSPDVKIQPHLHAVNWQFELPVVCKYGTNKRVCDRKPLVQTFVSHVFRDRFARTLQMILYKHDQGRLILTTQAWKQTLPPSDRILYYTSASV